MKLLVTGGAGFTPWDSRPQSEERRHPTGLIVERFGGEFRACVSS